MFLDEGFELGLFAEEEELAGGGGEEVDGGEGVFVFEFSDEDVAGEVEEEEGGGLQEEVDEDAVLREFDVSDWLGHFVIVIFIILPEKRPIHHLLEPLHHPILPKRLHHPRPQIHILLYRLPKLQLRPKQPRTFLLAPHIQQLLRLLPKILAVLRHHISLILKLSLRY